MKLALHSLLCCLVMFVGGICLLDNGKHVQHRTTTFGVGLTDFSFPATFVYCQQMSFLSSASMTASSVIMQASCQRVDQIW